MKCYFNHINKFIACSVLSYHGGDYWISTRIHRILCFTYTAILRMPRECPKLNSICTCESQQLRVQRVEAAWDPRTAVEYQGIHLRPHRLHACVVRCYSTASSAAMIWTRNLSSEHLFWVQTSEAASNLMSLPIMACSGSE